MQYTDLWPLIQADVLAALQSDYIIGSLPGVLIEPGSPAAVVSEAVTKALAIQPSGQGGVGYLILPIEEAHDDNANLPQGPLKMPIRIQFVENVVVNRGPRGTKVPIRVYAARAEKVLKLYWPRFLAKQFKPQNPVITEFTPASDETLRVGELHFMTEEDDNVQLIKVPMPNIQPNDGQGNGGANPQTVTITCPGATSIYYTLDNTPPWSGNPTAVLYAGPFTMNQAGLVRARGFAAGVQYIGSDAAGVSFT